MFPKPLKHLPKQRISPIQTTESSKPGPTSYTIAVLLFLSLVGLKTRPGVCRVNAILSWSRLYLPTVLKVIVLIPMACCFSSFWEYQIHHEYDRSSCSTNCWGFSEMLWDWFGPRNIDPIFLGHPRDRGSWLIDRTWGVLDFGMSSNLPTTFFKTPLFQLHTPPSHITR